MKKLVALALAGAMLCGMLAGCAPAKAPEKNPGEKNLGTMKVAFHPNLSGAGTIALAIEKGYFKEEGLTIDTQKFTSGPPEIAAMVSGDIDAGYLGHGAHALAINGQCEIFLTEVLTNSEELIVRADSGITDVAGLKGKTIATQFGTSGEVTLNNALEKAGMTRNDCNVINMEMGGAVTAMISKKVDAICAWAPYPQTVRKQMGETATRTIARSKDFMDKSVCMSSWVCTEDYMNKNKEKLEAFTRAIMKAQDYRKGHLDEMCKAVAKLADVDLETLMNCKEEAQWLTSKDIYDGIGDGTLAKWYGVQMDGFLATKKIDKKVDQSTYIHTDYMKKAFEANNKK